MPSIRFKFKVQVGSLFISTKVQEPPEGRHLRVFTIASNLSYYIQINRDTAAIVAFSYCHTPLLTEQPQRSSDSTTFKRVKGENVERSWCERHESTV